MVAHPFTKRIKRKKPANSNNSSSWIWIFWALLGTSVSAGMIYWGPAKISRLQEALSSGQRVERILQEQQEAQLSVTEEQASMEVAQNQQTDISVIILGLGKDSKLTEAALRLAPGLTLAFWMDAPMLEYWVEKARQNGNQVLLQVPAGATPENGVETEKTALNINDYLAKASYYQGVYTPSLGALTAEQLASLKSSNLGVIVEDASAEKESVQKEEVANAAPNSNVVTPPAAPATESQVAAVPATDQTATQAPAQTPAVGQPVEQIAANTAPATNPENIANTNQVATPGAEVTSQTPAQTTQTLVTNENNATQQPAQSASNVIAVDKLLSDIASGATLAKGERVIAIDAHMVDMAALGQWLDQLRNANAVLVPAVSKKKNDEQSSQPAEQLGNTQPNQPAEVAPALITKEEKTASEQGVEIDTAKEEGIEIDTAQQQVPAENMNNTAELPVEPAHPTVPTTMPASTTEAVPVIDQPAPNAAMNPVPAPAVPTDQVVNPAITPVAPAVPVAPATQPVPDAATNPVDPAANNVPVDADGELSGEVPDIQQPVLPPIPGNQGNKSDKTN